VTDAELIAAIQAAPDDDAPRLVYADLLMERGDPRGELILLQCRLRRDPGTNSAPTLEELIRAHPEWTTVPHARNALLRRGFVDSVVANPLPSLEELDEMLAVAPLLRTIHTDYRGFLAERATAITGRGLQVVLGWWG
jgi:uncharacterized protein (TIGR02996 family)